MSADSVRLAGQHEKCGLKYVFGIMRIAQDAAADAENQRSMPAHQGGKSRLVLSGDEPTEQLAVAISAPPGHQLPDVPQNHA
jgi:hypothetical protein